MEPCERRPPCYPTSFGDQTRRSHHVSRCRQSVGTPRCRQSLGICQLGSTALRGIGCGKLLTGGLGFVLLTVGIFWYQFHRIQVADETPRWSHLQWGYLFLILLCLPVETVASSLRVWLICRVLQPGVGLWTCFKAEWANVAIAMLTPSQSGGGPGEIYLLSRGGATVGTALTVCLLSFLGTMMGLLCMGLYSLLVSGLAHAGSLFAARLKRDHPSALAITTKEDVPFLYWAGASWAGALTAAKDDLDLIAELPIAGALVGRVLELDETYDLGVAHEFFISYEASRPGGSARLAREHYRRVLDISRGQRASVHLALAEAVIIPEQNLAEFRALLAAAMAVNPDKVPHLRPANTIATRRALWLETRTPDLFLQANHTEETP